MLQSTQKNKINSTQYRNDIFTPPIYQQAFDISYLESALCVKVHLSSATWTNPIKQ